MNDRAVVLQAADDEKAVARMGDGAIVELAALISSISRFETVAEIIRVEDPSIRGQVQGVRISRIGRECVNVGVHEIRVAFLVAGLHKAAVIRPPVRYSRKGGAAVS